MVRTTCAKGMREQATFGGMARGRAVTGRQAAKLGGVRMAEGLQPAEGLELYPGSRRKPLEVLRPRSEESGDLGFASLESGRTEEKRVGGEETEGPLHPSVGTPHLRSGRCCALGSDDQRSLRRVTPFLHLVHLLLYLSLSMCLLCLYYSIAWPL